MSTSLRWVSWKPAIGRAELHARLGVLERRLVARAAGADGAPADAEARLGQARQRPAHALDLGQDGVAGQAHVVERELGGDRRAQRELAVDVGGGEALGVGRHDEAADALVGLRPHDRDVGDAAVGDPHLRAVEDPVVAVALGASCACPPGRSRSRARSARSSRSPRPPPSAAATAASAPRSRTSRSGTSPASPARRPASAARSRRPPARGRRRRRPSRSRRRSRSPPGASRAGRGRRAPWPARATAACPPRTSPRPARDAPGGLRLRGRERDGVRRRVRELEAATPACAGWSRCRARWRCSPIWRFGSEEQKERVAAAAWPPARRSAASA